MKHIVLQARLPGTLENVPNAFMKWEKKLPGMCTTPPSKGSFLTHLFTSVSLWGLKGIFSLNHTFQ